MNNENYIGGTWLMVITSWIVEAQPILDIIATTGAIGLSFMGMINYYKQWQKKK